MKTIFHVFSVILFVSAGQVKDSKVQNSLLNSQLNIDIIDSSLGSDYCLFDSFVVLSNTKKIKSDTISFKFIRNSAGCAIDRSRKKIIIWQLNNSIFESYDIESKNVVDVLLINRNDISDMSYHEKIGYIFIIEDSIGHNNLLKIYPVVEKNQDINDVYSRKEQKIDCFKFNRIYKTSNKTLTLINNTDSNSMLTVYPNKKRGSRHKLSITKF